MQIIKGGGSDPASNMHADPPPHPRDAEIEKRVRTWSVRFAARVISSLSDFDPPSLSSITKSMGIFPFKQLIYRWQKLSHNSCTYIMAEIKKNGNIIRSS